MVAGNFNYTGRRKIKNSLVEVHVTERNDDFVRVNLTLDTKKLKNAENTKWVIDAFDRGSHQRKLLKFANKQTLDFNGFANDAKLAFKIRHIATGEDSGQVIASTPDIRPRESKAAIEREEFIEPTPKDLGAEPWILDWEGDPGNPEILINEKLLEAFGDWQDPVLQGLYLPVLVRELLTGIVMRSQEPGDIEDNSSLASRMMDFCEKQLGVDMPETDFHEQGTVNSDWLNWIDECVNTFCETRWRQGQTLMDQLIGEIR